MKTCSCVGPIAVLLAAMATRLPAEPAAQESPRTISEADLRGLLGTEIKERLARPARFTLLPNNIARVHVSRAGQPIIVMSKGNAYDQTPLAVSMESLARDSDPFRLMIEGNVVGMGSDGEIVVMDSRGAESAVLGPAGPRPTGLPKGLAISGAFRVGDQWIYQTSAGILDASATAVADGAESAARGAIVLPTERGVLMIQPNARAREGEDLPLVVTFRSAAGVVRRTFRNVPFVGIQGAVLLRDGQWLAIGEKLALLRDDWPALPPEADQRGALRAAEQRDESALATTLTALTLYRAETLRGLSEQLASLPDPTRDFREVEEAVRATLAVVDRWEARNKEDPDRPPSRELRDAGANYRTNAMELLAAVQRERGDSLAKAPATVAGLLRQGYQFFDGSWIARPRLLTQNRIDRAYLLVSWADLRNPVPRDALVVVQEDGRLRLLDELGATGGWANWNGAGAAEGAGCDWLFVPHRGLARVAQGALQWVDRSEPMKSMATLLGCDRTGRLYFAQPNTAHIESDAGVQPLFWVYRVDAAPTEGLDLRTIPTTSLPVADTLGRVWFVHNGEESRRFGEGRLGRRGPDAAPLEPDPLRQARPCPLIRRGTGLPAETGNGSGPTLYRYADGQIQRCLTQPGLRAATLLAGTGGALFVLPARASEPTLVIEDDTLMEGADLHALAETQFELLQRTAPVRTPPPPDSVAWTHSPGPPAALCRTGDLLWVCQSNRIEVYRHGKALCMDRRLALLGARANRSDVLGPVAGAPMSVLLVTRPGSVQDIFWATPTAEGITLERSAEPPADWPGGGTLTSPGQLSSSPLLDLVTRRVYCFNGFERVWAAAGPATYTPLPDAGRPALALRHGGMLVYRQARTYRGYRRFAGGAPCDLLPTYTRHLRIVREEEDERLLCVGPEGLAWLRVEANGETVIVREGPVRPGLRLLDYLAETANETCFLATDASQRLVIAVWQR